MVQAPISLTIRNGLSALTRKLVPEILVSGLASLLVMALFANVMKASPPPSRADRPGANEQLAAASSQTTADFMQLVALSHVGGVKPPPNAASADAPAEPTPAAAAPAAPLSVSAPGHNRPHAAMVRVPASTPDVLPPPRPSLATTEPAVVSEPPKAKPLPPLRYGVHLVTQLVDFVPASGTRVYEGMTSIGGALASFVKNL
jgi:hypothetical protein